MNKEEQTKSILSVRPANKLEKVSYEYLEELSINQATKIYVLQQENNQLKENNLAMQEEMCRTWEKLNIIKELKSWLEEVKEMYKNCNDDLGVAHFGSVLDKITYLEIEGNKNE